MSSKKWLIMFPAAILLAVCVCALFNILVDPFGVFGDPILRWYGYNETNNPRIAKVAWLEEHAGEYDSFIVGSSSAASYDVEQLDAYLDASFYNLFFYGSDALDYRDTVKYLLENHNVKNILLNLGVNECFVYNEGEDTLNQRMHAKVSGRSLIGFYLEYALGTTKNSFEKLSCLRLDTQLPQYFDVFIPETGVYDKRVRDVERIGDLAAYDAANPGAFAFPEGRREMPYIDECARCVGEIADMCQSSGVNLIVVMGPEYITRWNSVSEDSMRRYREAIAAVTDFWDFSFTSLSYDSRYFYDVDHFRNAAGYMAAAEIFSDPAAYRPDDFGFYVTKDNCAQYLDSLFSGSREAPAESYTRDVPILMYHHLMELPGDPSVVSRNSFESHLELLREQGYTPVSFRELADFVYYGGELPEKPVVITFDDGYLSNYEIAWPLLRQYGMKATFFPIGVSVGHKEFYKDTSYPLTPHFGFEEAREMVSSGLVEFGSHTWDMHQWPPFETGDRVRENALPFEDESEEEYIAALKADMDTYTKAVRRELGQEGFTALAYPGGQFSTLSEVVIHGGGIPVTVTTMTDRRNVVVRGLPQSLYALCRWPVTDDMSADALLAILAG